MIIAYTARLVSCFVILLGFVLCKPVYIFDQVLGFFNLFGVYFHGNDQSVGS